MKQLLAATLVIASLVAPVAWFFQHEPPRPSEVATVSQAAKSTAAAAARNIVTAAERRTDTQADSALEDMRRIAAGLRGLATEDRGAVLQPSSQPAVEMPKDTAVADLGIRAEARRAAGESEGAALAVHDGMSALEGREPFAIAPPVAAPIATIPALASTMARYASLPSAFGIGRGAFRLAGTFGAPVWLQREYPTVVMWYYLA